MNACVSVTLGMGVSVSVNIFSSLAPPVQGVLSALQVSSRIPRVRDLNFSSGLMVQ